ncbi:FAS1 domain-containing protein [Rozella allomycis CSF55]|uniref:FAS1 domain-containing protein n=1 Tax=Rozella allomycis (strain CSF55) TaxID=988480 RepID=A0A4P9YNL2_ROZAC|nr:FAS1 domain-containing protein [Rozella allomycis CSF55]
MIHLALFATLAFPVLSQNLTAAISNQQNLTQFSNLTSSAANFTTILNNQGQNATLFVPINSAYTYQNNSGMVSVNVTSPFLNQSISNALNLTNLLSYHLIPGQSLQLNVSNSSSQMLFHTPESRNQSVEIFYTALNDTQAVMLPGNNSQVLIVHNHNDTNPYIKFGPYKEANVLQGGNATNGVWYSLDSVLVPPRNLSFTLLQANLTMMYSILKASNMSNQLENTPGVTLFAPIDSAFPSNFNASNMTMANSFIQNYTVISNKTAYYSPLFLNNSIPQNEATMAGQNLSYTSQNWSNITVNGSQIVNSDILTMNGVVQMIDKFFNNNMNSTALPPIQAPAGASFWKQVFG